jgi:hypothetical protein
MHTSPPKKDDYRAHNQMRWEKGYTLTEDVEARSGER